MTEAADPSATGRVEASARRFDDPIDDARGWRFVCRSSRLSLNLAATLTGSGTREIERLSGPDDLREWAWRVGLTTDIAEMAGEQVTRDDVIRMRELREAVYSVATARMGGRAPEARAIALINAYVGAPDASSFLALDGRSLASSPGHNSLTVAGAVARDAIELFTGPHGDRIKECEHEDCTVLFVDTSRAQSRRWCAMSPCGDKINAQRYRDRGRDSAPSQDDSLRE